MNANSSSPFSRPSYALMMFATALLFFTASVGAQQLDTHPTGQAEEITTSTTIGYMSDWAPLSFTGQGGRPDGLISEYAGKLAAARPVKFVPFKTWRDARSSLRSGEIDAFIGIPKSERLRDGEIASDSLIELANVVVTRAEYKPILGPRELKNGKVLVSDLNHLASPLLRAAPDIALVSVLDVQDGLKRIESGDGDAYVGNLATVDREIREHYTGNLRIAAPAGFSDSLVLLARDDQTELIRQFNSILGSITPREREAIVGDWISVEYHQGIDWLAVAKWALPFGITALLAAVAISTAFLRLRRETVDRRLAESRLEEVTKNLPAVMYQLRRSQNGRLEFSFIAGDIHALFGIDLADAIEDERNLFARVHPEDRETLERAVEIAAQRNEPIAVDFRALSPTGYRWVSSSARPQRHGEGSRFWTGYWIDSEESHAQEDALKKATAAAESAAKAKGDFLATMSHELRTPMNGILGMVEILESTEMTSKQRDITSTIGESSIMLKQLLDDVLDVSKIEAGSLHLEQLPVDLRAKVAGVVRLVQPSVLAKSLSITWSASADLPKYVLGDSLRIRQILFNVIGNAVKFTHSGGISIRIDCQTPMASDRCEISITVEDTGIGIDKASQDQLFRPFGQANNSIAKKYGGTGLGLTIVHHLVEQMGGTVDLQSQIGVGTRVRLMLDLPIVLQENAPRIDAKTGSFAEVTAIEKGLRALVADDHPTSLDVMKWRVEQAGLECVTAVNGMQALEVYQSGHFDIIITDCRMPLMDGYQLAQAIRQREAQGKRIPIIAVTAGITPEELEACRKAGIDEVIAKPVETGELRMCVLRWLGEPVDEHENTQRVANLRPDGGESALERLIGIFQSEDRAKIALSTMIESTVLDIQQMRLLASRRQWSDVAGGLHKLSGAFAVIGQGRLSQESRALMAELNDPTCTDPAGDVSQFFSRVDGWVHAAREGL